MTFLKQLHLNSSAKILFNISASAAPGFDPFGYGGKLRVFKSFQIYPIK